MTQELATTDVPNGQSSVQPKETGPRRDWIDIFTVIILLLAAAVSGYSAILSKNVANQAQQTSAKEIEFQSELSANEAWISYRELLILHPDMAQAKIDFTQFDANEQIVYALLVERLLMSADLVTFSLADDKEWEGAFTIEFAKHRAYLASDQFLVGKNGLMSEYCTYRNGVRRWLLNAFKNDAFAHQEISKAEEKCVTPLDGATN